MTTRLHHWRPAGTINALHRTGSPSVVIGDSHIDGEGLFALRRFSRADIIAHSRGHIQDTRATPLSAKDSRIAFQIGLTHHFVPKRLVDATFNGFANINHSCDPNAEVEPDIERSVLILRALRTILPKQEITCDYCATEAKLAHPFKCRCGAIQCRGFIRGHAVAGAARTK